MAALNISYHHGIIPYACNKSNSCNFCPNLPSLSFKKPLIFPRKKRHIYAAISGNVPAVSAMTTVSVKEAFHLFLIPLQTPAIFDGNPKLYISYSCTYAQRVWITGNCKVLSLEHNNEVKGESLDLIRYIDSNFEGPSLFPDDPSKIEFGEEFLSFTGSFYKAAITSLKDNRMNETGAAFDDIETALSKFDDGPFFLGQFSLVDIAYATFIERFQPFFSQVKNNDITGGRPKLALWVEEMNKIEAYRQSQRDPKEHVESYN